MGPNRSPRWSKIGLRGTLSYLTSSHLTLHQNEASGREIATCKQNVGQKEDFMHSNFQMNISLP
jgi:hypothetical protein